MLVSSFRNGCGGSVLRDDWAALLLERNADSMNLRIAGVLKLGRELCNRSKESAMFDVERVSGLVGAVVATALMLAGCGGGGSDPVPDPTPVPTPTPGEMIYIPAGSFLMGNNGSEPDSPTGENPQHSVYLSGYYIGKYEVTRGEYRAFMDAGGYTNSSYWSSAGWSWKGSRTEPEYWEATQDWGTGPFNQTDNHPVVGVTYYEAVAFCNWAGAHLPTEAQWEKAARWTGSHPNVWPWGDTQDFERCNGWIDHQTAGGGYQKYQTAPVGSYPAGASPYGCMDMAGNVWEWCSDGFSYEYYSHTPPGGWIDPVNREPGSTGWRVLRGGSWSYDGGSYRCASRAYGFLMGGGDIEGSYGFRIVR